MSNKVKNFEVAYVNQYIQWWDVDDKESFKKVWDEKHIIKIAF